MSNSNGSMPLPYYLLLIAGIFYGFYQFQYVDSERRVTFRVQDKAIKVSGSDKSVTSTYMIYTNKGVFRNDDDLFRGKFNSSDFYNTLKVGETYQCKVMGWRYPFLSMYPNIMSVYHVDSTRQ